MKSILSFPFLKNLETLGLEASPGGFEPYSAFSGRWRELNNRSDDELQMKRGQWSDVLRVFDNLSERDQRYVDKRPPEIEIKNCCTAEFCQNNILTQIWFTNTKHTDISVPNEEGEIRRVELESSDIENGVRLFNEIGKAN